MADWGNPDAADYAQQHIVTINMHGVKVQVNENIATNVMGFLDELWNSGYRFKSVQGYNNRNIAGSSKKSNHAYGAAFDIDPGQNPQVKGANASAKYALPANVGEIAARHGLGWGGNYKNSKDYMHFEALDAPSSPKVTAQATTAPRPVAATTAPAAQGAPVPTDPLPKNATAQQIRDRVERDYGYLAAYLHDKELGPILTQAALEDWDAATLQGAISKTKWWKTTSDSARTWEARNRLDPAKAKAEVGATMSTLAAQAKDLGIVIGGLDLHDLAVNVLKFGWNPQQIEAGLRAEGKADPRAKTARDFDRLKTDDPATYQKLVTDTTSDLQRAATKLGVTLDPKQAGDMAVRAQREGWTADDINHQLSALVTVGVKNTGQTAVTVDTLKAQAASYLVPLSEQTLQLWTRQIMAGDQTADSFTSYLKEQAKAMRPWMAKQIDAGVTPGQIADPYKQMASQELERSADDIDLLNDPKFSVALDTVDPKTGERRPMSFTEWRTYLRGTDAYQTTAQANDIGAQFVAGLAKDFGRLAG